MIRTTFFFLWLLLFAQIGEAQKTTVFVSINEEDALLDNTLNQFHVRISMQDSVLYESDFVNGLSRLRLDNVPIGELIVEVKLTTDNQVQMTRRFSLLDEDINECSMTIYSDCQGYSGQSDVTTTTIQVVSIGAMTDIDVGYVVNFWSSLGKHIGFCGGYGLDYERYKLKSPILNPTGSSKSPFYRSSNVVFNSYFRFTSASQQTLDPLPRGLTLDIGAQYKLPVVFQYVESLGQGERVIKNHIHQFRDFRVFSNIGYGPVLLFFEYRPFDFVLGNFAEMPKYNAGVRFSIGTD